MLNHQNESRSNGTQFRNYMIFYALYERGVVCYTSRVGLHKHVKLLLDPLTVGLRLYLD